MTAAADHQPGAVIDRLCRGCERHAALRERRKCTHHRCRHRSHDRFHHLVEKHGDAAYFTVTRIGSHREFLEPLHAGDDEAVLAQRALFHLTRPRLFLLLLEQGGELDLGVLDAERLDLHLTVLCGPARALRSIPCLRHQLHRQTDAHAGGRVDHDSPAEFVFVRLCGGEKVCALARRKNAGNPGFGALLVVLDGGGQWILAANRAGIVTGPQQRGLDFHAITGRKRRPV